MKKELSALKVLGIFGFCLGSFDIVFGILMFIHNMQSTKPSIIDILVDIYLVVIGFPIMRRGSKRWERADKNDE